MSNNNNCQQCNPAPCACITPAPTCTTAACEEYIQSDCVISSIEASCQSVFQGPNGDVNIGLDINQGTTLSDILQQLTSTACITNVDVVGGMLQIIQNNSVLNQIFCDMVCNCSCDDPCATVNEVEQMIFTNITDEGFDLTFVAQPNYNYYIRINDVNTIPETYYVYDSTNNPTPSLPNILANPVSVTLSTSSFSKYVNNILVPGPFVLASNTGFEVLITATVPDESTSCETGPYSIQTLSDPDCNCTTTILVTDAAEVPFPGQLSINIDETGGTVPVAYNVTVKQQSTGDIVDGPSDITRDPDGITTYTVDLPGDTYVVEVIPVCSLDPRCTGETEFVSILVVDLPSCAPPEITSITTP